MKLNAADSYSTAFFILQEAVELNKPLPVPSHHHRLQVVVERITGGEEN